MGLATTYSRALVGVEAPLVTVETHLSNGLPAFNIVGLPEVAVKESKERVRSAIINSGLDFPARRITVNLGPADLPKSGGRYDLAIAIGILAASAQLPDETLASYEILGELGLNGSIRPVQGCLSAVLQAKKHQRTSLLPIGNKDEANLIPNAEIGLVDSLLGVFAHFVNQTELLRPQPQCPSNKATHSQANTSDNHRQTQTPDLEHITGLVAAKRAIKIAAAGRHNLLMVGPPGTGKTLLASVMPNLLPDLKENEALELAAIQAVSGNKIDPATWRRPPFRSPHHTSTAIALVGGGSRPRPGEVSLAHHGLLFLDELTEFNTKVLEVLREPLEARQVSISRANYRVKFPANFQLVAAMNPCPCGYKDDPVHECKCSEEKIDRYQSKLSGPFLDRFDMKIEVPRFSASESMQWKTQQNIQADLQNKNKAKTIKPETNPQAKNPPQQTTAIVKTEIQQCHELQLCRCKRLNSEFGLEDIERFCKIDTTSQLLLNRAVSQFGMSHRAIHRTLKLAKTIADLDEQSSIREQDLLEALSYRSNA